MAYDATKPVTGGSLVAADIRENFRALKEDSIVAALTVPDLAIIEVKLGTSAVSQAKLKVTDGTISVVGPGWGLLTLPGGGWGFYPYVWVDAGGGGAASIAYGGEAAVIFNNSGGLARIRLYQSVGGFQTYAIHRYVTSSGEVHWVFILRDKTTKQTIARWQAPDHPCFGNGGKPEVVAHPFGDYDPLTHEIIVINPSRDEIEEMSAMTVVDDETKPDKDLLQIITENYEIDEGQEAPWPKEAVTVGLPKHITDKNGKKHLADYRFMPAGMEIKPIKKVIPRPDYILCRKLRKKII